MNKKISELNLRDFESHPDNGYVYDDKTKHIRIIPSTNSNRLNWSFKNKKLNISITSHNDFLNYGTALIDIKETFKQIKESL